MPLADYLARPDAPWVYLLDASPRDASGVAQTVGFGRGDYADPTFGSTTRQFRAFLEHALNVEQNINPLGLGTGQGTTFGVSVVTGGWPSGSLDALAEYGWDGRPVTIKLGLRTDTLASFEAIFSGKAAGHTCDNRRLTILLRDYGADFDSPIQFESYAGTGSNAGTGACEGGAELEGVWKPIALGHPMNVTPVLVDPALFIYQVHHRKAKAITVYDGGANVPLNGAGDTTNLVTWAPGGGDAGTMRTDLSKGLFRLAAAPTFNVTCDVEGENDGTFTTHPRTAAELVGHVLYQYTGRSSGDIDSGSFTALGFATTATLSFYVGGGQNPTVRQVLDAILGSVGGFWWIDRLGDVHVGQLAFDTSALTIRASEGKLHALERLNFIPPFGVRIPYARSWTVGPAHVAGNALSPHYVGTAAQSWINERSKAWQLKAATDTAIKNVHALSKPVRRDAYFDDGTDAQDEADRQLALLETASIWNVEASRIQFLPELGSTVTVIDDVTSRFGFGGAGRDGIVLGVVEDTGTRKTRLRLLVEAP